MRLPILFFLLLSSFVSFAQMPKTEIWVFDFVQKKDGYKISKPTKIKVGDGYNNQPYFTRDGEKMLFVSNGKKQGKTDIYSYTFNKKRRQIKRLTKTKREAEYSPKYTPDQTRISCVRVAKDTVTQNLCTYNMKGKKAKILFPDTKTFGYYCWRSQIELMAFHVPEPFTFRKHNLIKNTNDSLDIKIGRCILNSRNKIIYVDKSDSTDWKIKMLNNKRIGNRKFKTIEPDQTIAHTLKGEEDFAILRGKDLLMGHEGFIYLKKNALKNSSSEWKPILDLNHFKIYNFYRIAVSPIGNKIAVVAYSGDKP